MYDKKHYNIVISLQIIKINEKEKKKEMCVLFNIINAVPSTVPSK